MRMLRAEVTSRDPIALRAAITRDDAGGLSLFHCGNEKDARRTSHFPSFFGGGVKTFSFSSGNWNASAMRVM